MATKTTKPSTWNGSFGLPQRTYRDWVRRSLMPTLLTFYIGCCGALCVFRFGPHAAAHSRILDVCFLV